MTYKAYVEDEEDERTEADSIDVDASDDELFDSDQPNGTYEKRGDSSNETDKESFMDVLAALIVSEEFQGIVSSETGNTKVLDDVLTKGSTIPRPRGLNAESIPLNNINDSEGSRGVCFNMNSHMQLILTVHYLWFIYAVCWWLSKTCQLQDQPYFGLLSLRVYQW